MDLQAHREKLSDFSPTAYPTSGEEVPVDWPASPISRVNPQGASPSTRRVAELAATVETLKKRSAQTVLNHSIGHQVTAQMLGQPSSFEDVELHLRRLQVIADRINDFSLQQSQAMVEMNQIQQRLAAYADVHGQPVPAINFEEAVIASVEVDEEGNFLLSYQTFNVDRQTQAASELAEQLRGTYGFSGSQQPTRTPGISSDLSMLWREPLSLILQFWEGLNFTTLLPSNSKTASGVPISSFQNSQGSKSKGKSLTLTDGIIWLGGGVLGRVALNLILAAFPALWSLAVAGITGMTAYALYRATFAPKLDFGLAYRILLIVGGLIIGGRFGI
jgi:hypothetical protein